MSNPSPEYEVTGWPTSMVHCAVSLARLLFVTLSVAAGFNAAVKVTMELAAIGVTVVADWLQPDFVPTQLAVGWTTSVKGGAAAIHTRYGQADNNGQGFEDGPNVFNPGIFWNDYTVCNSLLHSGIPPADCRQKLLHRVLCTNTTQCVAAGEIDNRPVSLGLCWKKPSLAVTSVFVAGNLKAKADSCLPLVARGELYATRVQHIAADAVVVSFYEVGGVTTDLRSTLLAVIMALLLVLWIEQPLLPTYYWLTADIVLAPLLFNIANVKPDSPTGCDMCNGDICRWVCSIPISSYLWAISGISLPGALLCTLSRRWPKLTYLTLPTFSHVTVVITLLAATVAHIPVNRFGKTGIALVYYFIGGAMCTVCGRAAAGPFQNRAELALTYTLLALTVAHASAVLFRTIVQMHPSFDPTDVQSVACVSLFLSSTFAMSGRYGAK